MPDANELLHSNLHEVFAERDPERRRAAIERVSVMRTLIAVEDVPGRVPRI
jgi:hypothetical protein